MPFAYLSLGSNIGYRKKYLKKAIKFLRKNCCELLAVSNIYTTEPLEVTNQPYFANCLIKVKTKLSPISLLHLCKHIEKEIGRFKTFRYGPRVIDIDILSYNYCIGSNDMIEILNHSYNVANKELTIPHPKSVERDFIRVLFDEVLGNSYKKLQGVNRGDKIGHRASRS
ncbi:2-amino-4-hydroxy-6-hydroxymethyldihydropteridine pyrophosphokinase [Thermodesulfobium narugense DSM 14796]|uniref:2-amino-4-hydroxy-6-hydroxymethyldihydropteridine pyrophosphokinase n=1 Tax=Thermodesulfobium narugense DSM 14796 TaxID=747365 RepID=M1E622_9BACT|nr:2-amino-4-hydroxy-6-hydroxymethyldihydropteridine diphosphokinase [Thermodesulfobium narugense]AEE15377.1 2-amino-4-hydroxy-6-hydroxymethyldihydropteridine pyrophosphokinase [Thermodesulfobium narugense DSM 14796]